MDYRFKISGNTNPFRVQVFSGATEVKDLAIDYSGTCVVINNLREFGNYSLSISDGINSSVSCPIDTSPIGAQVIPDVPTTKTFGIIGTPTQPSGPTPGTVCCVSTPKTLSITPALSANDCACVCVEISLDDNESGDVFNNATLYKSCNGAAYTQLVSYNTNGNRLEKIDMGQNDSLCYNLSSIYDEGGVGDNISSASIKIIEVNPKSGTFISEIDSATSAITTNINYTVTTTTTSTTQTPIVLSFDLAETSKDPASAIWTVITGIRTSRQLQTGECVQICFTNDVYTCAGDYANTISANGNWYDSHNDQYSGGVLSLIRQNTITSGSDTKSDSIILTPENQDSIVITLSTNISPLDMEKLVCARAQTTFNRLDKQFGTNFEWDTRSLVSLILTKQGSGSGREITLLNRDEPSVEDGLSIDTTTTTTIPIVNTTTTTSSSGPAIIDRETLPI